MHTKEVAVVDELAVSLALAFAGDVPVKEEPVDTDQKDDGPSPSDATDGCGGTRKTGKRVLTRRDTVLNLWVASTKKMKINIPSIK